jgi:hypothetical protein
LSEYTITYPLCQKYDAPIIAGHLDESQQEAWVKSLPDDWPSRFWEVCGRCTVMDGKGFYACDIEDTLWALERNQPYRRWDG